MKNGNWLPSVEYCTADRGISDIWNILKLLRPVFGYLEFGYLEFLLIWNILAGTNAFLVTGIGCTNLLVQYPECGTQHRMQYPAQNAVPSTSLDNVSTNLRVESGRALSFIHYTKIQEMA